MRKDCPICVEKYFLVSRYYKVCQNHQDWIVTRCQKCDKFCFSDCRGACLECYPDQKSDRMLGGGKDRRAVLRGYGLESYDG